MTTYTEEQIEEMYDEMLDECYPDMFGHCASKILSEVDPIAYRCGLADFSDQYEIEGE
jgi:hypothetical protein